MPLLPPACARFHALFREHWQAGTGLNSPVKWTPRTFANAMGKVGYKSHDSKTTRSWLDGTTWPTRARKDAILDIFFPDALSKPRLKAAEASRCAMEAAWRAGQESRSRVALSALGQPGAEWFLEEQRRHTDLAGIDLHQPQQTNSANYRLDVSLRFAPGQYSVDDVDVIVGLTEALVSVAAPGFAIAQKSLINERTDLPHFKPAVSGVAIIGPREKDGMLSGNPVGDEFLAVIEPRGDTATTVTVSISAVRSNIAYAMIDDPASVVRPTVPTPNRAAILAAILKRPFHEILKAGMFSPARGCTEDRRNET